MDFAWLQCSDNNCAFSFSADDCAVVEDPEQQHREPVPVVGQRHESPAHRISDGPATESA